MSWLELISLLYHPHCPLFPVTCLKVFAFNLTTTPADESPHLSTRINVTLSARNPNNKITYLFDPISITVRSNSIDLSKDQLARGESTDANDQLFSVMKSPLFQMKTKLDVSLASNTAEKACDFKIEGSWFQRSCVTYAGKQHHCSNA